MSKGVGKGGKSVRDVWRANGLSEEEIDRKDAERLARIAASRARTIALRNEKDALAAGLGDAVLVAHQIVKSRKELDREFRNSPLKGTRHQTTVLKNVQKRQKQTQEFFEKQENPRIKGLANVAGVTVDADGTVGLRDLRQQRPDIFEAEPLAIEGSTPNGKIAIAIARRKQGRKDKYDHLIPD